jgi:predicted nucleotidyltransferase
LQGYKRAEAVERFIKECEEQPWLRALVLFGSLAKDDWHEYSDADFCVIVNEASIAPLDKEWWKRVHSLGGGVAQPFIYGHQQFLRMIDEIHGLAVEVGDHGILVAGDEEYWKEVGRRFQAACEHYQLEKVPGGWRWDPAVEPR